MALVPIWDVAPYYAAEQQGYFAAENLACSPFIVRGGAAGASPAVVSGSLRHGLRQTASSIVHGDHEAASIVRIIIEGSDA